MCLYFTCLCKLLAFSTGRIEPPGQRFQFIVNEQLSKKGFRRKGNVGPGSALKYKSFFSGYKIYFRNKVIYLQRSIHFNKYIQGLS